MSMTQRWAEEVEELLDLVRERMGISREWEDGEVREMIDEVLLSRARMPVEEKLRMKKVLFDELRGFGVVQDLLEDPQITEIMINGPDRIFIERGGRLYPTKRRFSSAQKLEEMIRRMAARVNRTVSESRPIADVRLEDGSRVNIVLSPVALDGPAVTIRKFTGDMLSLEQMVKGGSLDEAAADFLREAVREHRNILISGGTGCGKTTFLNALSEFIPEEERVVTIEDSAELQLRNIPNLVRLEVRGANLEGQGEITIRDLVKTALRMRPTRLLIGETRDQAAADLLSAWNTGHDGSLSTIHANSTKDAVSRLETLVLTGAEMPLAAIRAQIASAIDLIVHLGRSRDGSRKVMEISRVAGMEDGEVVTEVVYSCREERACGPEGTREPKEAREGAEVKDSQEPKEKPERSAADETEESEGRTEGDVL